jgi:hypothetical protein
MKNVRLLKRVNTWVPYLFIALGSLVTLLGKLLGSSPASLLAWAGIGFVIACLGQVVKDRMAAHIKRLEDDETVRRKRLPPEFTADLYWGGTDGKKKMVLMVSPKHAIPVRGSWALTTAKRHAVWGIMMGDVALHPLGDGKQWVIPLAFDPTKVVDGVVDLTVTLRSPFAAEFGYPPELIQTLSRSYVFSEDQSLRRVDDGGSGWSVPASKRGTPEKASNT